jgi:RHS repeat-associated protein
MSPAKPANPQQQNDKPADSSSAPAAPSIRLPTGGGAVRGIGEKFAANPVLGSGSLTIPLATSPGRSGFGPQLALSYDSNAGNGPFGLGWSIGLASVTRKTDKGLPRYNDAEDSDVFVLSSAEDLVPTLQADGTIHGIDTVFDGSRYLVHRYRPRTEGLFARIERWTRAHDSDTHWRATTRDNVTSIYGRTAASRIGNPDQPRQVFSWLICESFDDKGNAIVFEYAEENDHNVEVRRTEERLRTPTQRSANRYIKAVRYGNTVPHRTAADLATTQWLFTLLFDYGEGHLEPEGLQTVERGLAQANFAALRAWPARPDSFSRARSGFEVRTHRLCRRVLMFHHFAEELGAHDVLVRSTDFTYAEDPIATTLTRVAHSGYVRQADGRYLRRSVPPLDLAYSKATIQSRVSQVDQASLANLPGGVDSTRWQWVDLDGEGSSGLLAEHAGAWHYTRNHSAGTFDSGGGIATARAQLAPAIEVASLPGYAQGPQGRHRLVDLDGDGQLECAVLEQPDPGFYSRTAEEDWSPHRALASVPNRNWNDPNLRMVDLTGDGFADVLITEDEAITWYPSLGKAGYGPAVRVHVPKDEDRGPRVLFGNQSEAVLLADMGGDGLSDLVRIRHGEVCYWPNLGYGRFGAKVTMGNAPSFDTPDQFDPKRLRLSDVAGSGLTDLIYLGRREVWVYFNQSGNTWSTAQAIPFPQVDKLSNVQVLDLLGIGTACLVWTSPLPGDARQPIRYIDLMGSAKPHLLIAINNNLGARTRISYAPSTKFYVQDKLAGQPWLTKLPFPVQVVERVEVIDQISRSRFVTRSTYHHGYFDGIEREFRGFGRVDQYDTEELALLRGADELAEAQNFDAASYVPPVLTKSWFHNGAWLGAATISKAFEREYYREGDAHSLASTPLSDDQLAAMSLPDTLLPPELPTAEKAEACRSLRGSLLRQEVYALDGSAAAGRPYLVAESNFTVKRLQPRGPNRYAVFFTHAREALQFHYERQLRKVGTQDRADPRVTHHLVLDIGDFGEERLAADVAYGRRYEDSLLLPEDRSRQSQLHVTFVASDYSPAIDVPEAYRGPLPTQVRSFELLKLKPAQDLPDTTPIFRFEELAARIAQASDGSHDLPYEDHLALGAIQPHPYRRLVEHVRTIYRSDDLQADLPLGQSGALAIGAQSYKLAFTPGLLKLYSRDGVDLVPDTAKMLGQQGGYVIGEDLRARGIFPASNAPGQWWVPSGRSYFAPQADTSAAAELAEARAHFFLPRRFRNPFGHDSWVGYDGYDLLVLETEDALGNKASAGTRTLAGTTTNRNNYRVLQAEVMTDPNRNRSQVAFDALGLVVGTAVMGKLEGPVQGDLIDAAFQPDLTPEQIEAFITSPRLPSDLPNESQAAPIAHSLLARASSRIVYDLHRFMSVGQPPLAATIARETHASDLAPGEQPKLHISFSYSDGFGREIQKKVQAEPGPVLDGGTAVSPRWVGSGWTLFNNKGKPVRQYEPFFDDSHAFRFGHKVGVSSSLFYDPMGRVVATLHPNHTWEKVVFDPWRQESWDVNDIVLVADPKTDPHAGAFFARLPTADYLPTWHAQRQSGVLGAEEQRAADKATQHAATPSVAHADSLGRTFLTVAHNRFKFSNAPASEPVKEEFSATRVEFDIEGNQRAVRDAKVQAGDALGRIVMRYEQDMLGHPLHQISMEAGARWMLADVAGQPLFAWDSRGHRFRTGYDELHRPTQTWLQEGASAEQLIGKSVYGESQPNPEATNLRGKTVQVFDQAGVVTSSMFDFKGNPLQGQRQLANNYKTTLDWQGAQALDAEVYTSRTRFDALNRAVEATSPDNSIVRPHFSEANLLESIEVNLRGAQRNGQPVWTPFVTNIDHDAKGQRLRIDYANGSSTVYAHDPLTFRLTRLKTTRSSDGAALQDLRYTYDPAGNITHIEDSAQQTIYFNNQRVDPHNDYTYDALYRLIEASGREHLGQVGGAPVPHSYNDAPRVGQHHPGNGQAMGRYLERYVYDVVGNFLELQHRGTDPNHAGWTRGYTYGEPSLIEPGKTSNRLSSTAIVGANPLAEPYAHDAHGNMLKMPHLQVMLWDFEDQLRLSQRQKVNEDDADGAARDGERTFYVYDGAGQRVRKVTELASGSIKDERIYLGSFEVFRKLGANALVRETLHVLDDKQRIAQVETRTQRNDGLPEQLIRFQLSNHLGSAYLELGGASQVISYEEYTPYGSSSYKSAQNENEAPNRYRYTDMERDEETGFGYHGARYLAHWLGRWVSCDPIGIGDGINCFSYAHCKPTGRIDRNGMQDIPSGAPMTKEQQEDFKKQGEMAHKVWGEKNLTPLENWLESHPTAGAALEFIQFAGSLLFVVQDAKSLASGVTSPKLRTVAPPKTPTPDLTPPKSGQPLPVVRPQVVPAPAVVPTPPVHESPVPPRPAAAPPLPVPTSDRAPPSPSEQRDLTGTPCDPTRYIKTPRNIPIVAESGKPLFDVWVGGLLRVRLMPGKKWDGISSKTRDRIQKWAEKWGTIDGPPTTAKNTNVGHVDGQGHVFTLKGPAQAAAQTVAGNSLQSVLEKKEAALRRAWNLAHPELPPMPVRAVGAR